ncbi:MAG: hypothetical protein J1F14_08105 [Treponema sp.]|nr:hypothetical protein [Treponema sp.]
MADNNQVQNSGGPIWGRKTFFLNPSFTVLKDTLKVLHEHEFEVYTIANYREVKNILAQNKDSILYINIAAQLSMEGWFNFIRSIEQDPALNTTQVGLISGTLKPEVKEFLFENLKLPCGIITVENTVDVVSANIIDVLNAKNAKGRRQYVRASCLHDKEANMLWMYQNRMLKFKLIDVSSIGMAAIASPQIKSIISEKSLLRDVTLNIGHYQYNVNLVVLAIKPGQDGNVTLVCILGPDTPVSIRDSIRYYVGDTLQTLMDLSQNNAVNDNADYNNSFSYYKDAMHKFTEERKGFSTQAHKIASHKGPGVL